MSATHSLDQSQGIEEDALWGACSNKKLRTLTALLKRLELEISGKVGLKWLVARCCSGPCNSRRVCVQGVFKEEFVTAGGVPLSEVGFSLGFFFPSLPWLM